MISIALCTYNGEKYIKEQLNSIITQTVPPDEIIISDDCSHDNTQKNVFEVMNKWRGHWKFVKNTTNLGYRKNFEKAIGLCQGDFIYLADQDDVWEKNKLEVMNEVFQKDESVLMVFHDAEVVDEKLEKIDSSLWQEAQFNPKEIEVNNYSFFFYANPVQGAACAFKKELFERAIPFSHEAVHDEWLALIAAITGKIVPVNKTLLKYRQTGNNARGASVSEQMPKSLRWMISLKYKLTEHMNYLVHKKNIWEEISTRYPRNKLNGSSVLDYYLFLSKRYNCIKNKKWLNLPRISFYQSIYGSKKLGIKQYIKDRLVMLLR